MVQNIFKKIEVENKETSDPNEINNEIDRLFNKLFAKTLQKSLPQVNNFFKNIIFHVLNQEQKQDCKKEFFESYRCT